MRKSCSYIILTICIFSSCTSRPLRIARQTLHEADSLRAAGVLFDDLICTYQKKVVPL